jgi:hypothetical protein
MNHIYEFPPAAELDGMIPMDLCAAYGAFLQATNYPAKHALDLLMYLIPREDCNFQHINWLDSFVRAWREAHPTRRTIWILMSCGDDGAVSEPYTSEEQAHLAGLAWLGRNWKRDWSTMPHGFAAAAQDFYSFTDPAETWFSLHRFEVTL